MSFRNPLAYSTVALLFACNARLAVMDQPLEGDDASSGGIDGGARSTASCDDSIKNANEIGVDCGGNCAPCAPCDCAVSDALIPLSCADSLGPGMTWNRGYPETDATGDTVSFDACADEQSASPTCRQFIYRSGTGLSELTSPSGSGYIRGLSADGEHALFLPALSLGEALVYRSDGSWTGTGLAPTTAIMAADGSVAGFSAPKPNGRVDLMRWTAVAGNTVAAELPFAAATARPYLTSISSDGLVVAGNALVDDIAHGFIYHPENGLLIDLGDDLPETAMAAEVQALSGTGDAASGLLLGTDPPRVFHWSAAGGLVDIGALVPSPFPGVNVNVHLSTDGSVVAATLESPRNASASRWTSAGVASLFPDGQDTVHAIDADGSTIIGLSFDAEPQFSLFAWTPETGSRSVYAALQSAGVDVTGWVLDQPHAISANGKVVTGFGQCGGARTSFRLVLPD